MARVSIEIEKKERSEWLVLVEPPSTRVGTRLGHLEEVRTGGNETCPCSEDHGRLLPQRLSRKEIHERNKVPYRTTVADNDDNPQRLLESDVAVKLARVHPLCPLRRIHRGQPRNEPVEVLVDGVGEFVCQHLTKSKFELLHRVRS